MGSIQKFPVSESIFNGVVGGDHVVIPMADVTSIRIDEWGTDRKRKDYHVSVGGEIVHLKHYMGEKFMKAWTMYRHEVEGGGNVFYSPEDNRIMLNQAKG